MRNGALVSERYFNGDSSTTLHDIRSATKSVTSLLMGIAIDEKIALGYPIVTDDTPSIYNAVVEHELSKGGPIPRCDFQVSLSCGPIDRNMPPMEGLDIQWTKEVSAGEIVKSRLASQVPISDSDPYADFYGYMWYTKAEPIGGRKVTVHFASGNGGNKIYIVPSLHMVVAITSSAYGSRWGQRRSQDILFKILAATKG